jgi:neutral ceramidase
MLELSRLDHSLSVNGKSDAPLYAGASAVDITPGAPIFLHGYPHVNRISTGVHDPLFASALFLGDGATGVLFVACDLLSISKGLTGRARQRIKAATGVNAAGIVVSATHTHSGPKMILKLGQEADKAIPPPDAHYPGKVEDAIVAAAFQAWSNRVAAEVALVQADARGVGTNRHDPSGPSDPRVPVLMVRSLSDCKPIGLMLSVCMHPTVLHEDSTLVSADFPGLARQYIQRAVLGTDCPVVYQTGTAGNQSPRHVTRANTFDEARRLGEILGRSVEAALAEAQFTRILPLACMNDHVDLPPRKFVSPIEAARSLKAAHDRLDSLRKEGASRTAVRTAECDWFGAEETLTLAHAAESGRIQDTLASILPVEIQIIRVGPRIYVAWPGEMFVEFGLNLVEHCANTFVISLANGELQGYLVTREAVEQGYYEAGNALLASPEGGEQLVAATIALLDQLPLDHRVQPPCQ